MMYRTLALLFGAISTGLLAFACFSFWSQQHAPLFRQLDRLWAADVALLQGSGKLPASWQDIREIKLIGGTPETKLLLPRLNVPLQKNPKGAHRMDVLLVLWEENGKRGLLIQYDIEELKSANTVAEISRTLILDDGH